MFVVLFEITKNGVTFAQLSLPKKSYRLGEELQGILKFYKTTNPCYKFIVILESFEEIDPKFSVKSAEANYNLTKSTYYRQEIFCLFAESFHFNFVIPTHIAPTFISKIGKNANFNCFFNQLLAFVLHK